MYTGGCLCGAVRFEIHGAIREIVCCHCSECRKAQGSAFATNGNVNAKDFILRSGEELLTAFESSPGHSKYFCSVCGSPIMSKRKTIPDIVRVRLGTIESPITERPTAHIFVASKASWETIGDTIPSYGEFEPRR